MPRPSKWEMKKRWSRGADLDIIFFLSYHYCNNDCSRKNIVSLANGSTDINDDTIFHLVRNDLSPTRESSEYIVVVFCTVAIIINNKNTFFFSSLNNRRKHIIYIPIFAFFLSLLFYRSLLLRSSLCLRSKRMRTMCRPSRTLGARTRDPYPAKYAKSNRTVTPTARTTW